jgi:hypothetical protein
MVAGAKELALFRESKTFLSLFFFGNFGGVAAFLYSLLYQ